MSRLMYGLIVVVWLGLSISKIYADFQAGAAVKIITPDPLLPISGGLGPTTPAEGKLGELSVRALVVKQDSTTVAIVSIDALGFPSVLSNRVRGDVAGIPPENVLISATHTHSAPDCYAFPDGKGGHTGDLKYIDFVCQQTAAAINEAHAKLQPARLRVATGEAEGRIAFNYYAPDLYDRRVSIIQLIDVRDQAIATLVNYAVHPEVLGTGGRMISPDLVGPLCERIESQVGGSALFVNGAQGGMVTADNRLLDKPSDATRGYWQGESSWAECERIGHTLADEALRFLKSAPVQVEPQLQCTALAAAYPVDNELLWQVIQHSPLKYPHTAERQIITQMNFIQLGNAHILTIPGEALPNIGFYLKRKMRGEHNLLFGLTNDAFGYILTEVDFDSFKRYEYVSRTSLGERTGPLLIKYAQELMGLSR